MKLQINTTSSEKIKFILNGESFESDARELRSQRMLPFLLEILNDKGVTLKDITEVEVNTGPGSYTGIRVGVAVAQTLGWALKIPVNGKLLTENDFIEIDYGESRFN